MKTNLLALALILVAALWRVANVFEPSLFNVAPVTALAFCGAAYFRDWRRGQAMAVGHPEFPPTLWFFRNTLVGDLLFTGLFVAIHQFNTVRLPATAGIVRG